jgi:hypothetical protein
MVKIKGGDGMLKKIIIKGAKILTMTAYNEAGICTFVSNLAKNT